MTLIDIIAAVRREQALVREQAQLARDIQHLREVARMLFEDKPDKTKAVEAVNDIAAKRLARMHARARELLESASPTSEPNGPRDPGDRLSWLMRINRPGCFPYTQGIRPSGLSSTTSPTETRRTRVLGDTPPAAPRDGNPAPYLAGALADGWRLLATAERCDEQASQIAIAFNEHRDATHRALGRAARRLWAVSLRDCFDVAGEGLKLVLIPAGDTGTEEADCSNAGYASGHATDLAEGALLAALQSIVVTSVPD